MWLKHCRPSWQRQGRRKRTWPQSWRPRRSRWRTCIRSCKPSGKHRVSKCSCQLQLRFDTSLLWVWKFNAFVPLGLSAFVPLWFSAFVPLGLSAFVPLWLSAFVPLFLAGWKPPRAGEVLPKFSILSLTHAISSLLCSLRRRVQTIPLACHRRLITSTLRRSPVLHRCPGGHTSSFRRRSRDVELCDVELVIINLWCWTLVHLWWIFDGFIKYACACDI